MLKWNTISDHDDYADLRTDLLVLLEGSTNAPYVDTAGVPTIGVGFNLRVNLSSVLTAMVGDYASGLYNQLDAVIDKTYSSGANSTLISSLNSVMKNWHKVDSSVPSTFAFTGEAQISKALDLISPTYDSILDNWISDIPDSDERAALFSLTWNNPSLLGSGLKAAVESGDRAEAWFQIRYYSNGGASAGIANRRYVEADLFGLYDTDGKAKFSESIEVGQMLANHHEKIVTYEASYDPETAASTKGVDSIVDIGGELQPAINTALKHFGLTAKIEIDELLATSSGSETLYGDGTSMDSSVSDQDLILGDKAVNTLIGGIGADVLVGGHGADVLNGGDGDDIFVFSSTKDSARKAADLITDFTSGEDQIALTKSLAGDYTLLDFKQGLSGDDAEISWRYKHGDTIVTIDQDGDGHGDLTIRLDHKVSLTASDFLL